MKQKIIYIYILSFTLLLFGCKEDKLTDLQDNTSNLVNITVPQGSNAKTKTNVSQKAGSRDIVVKWKNGDKIDLFFEQGSTLKLVKDVALVNIASNGKTAQFKLQTPVEINKNKNYTLYGAHGCDTKIENGKPVVAMKLKTAILEANGNSDLQVPMYFETEVKNTQTTVAFKHLGAMYVTKLHNNSGENITEAEEAIPVIFSPGDEENLTYDIYKELDLKNKTSIKIDNPLEEEIVASFPRLNLNDQETASLLQWVAPKSFSGRKTNFLYILELSTSNPIFARQMTIGKAYHMQATLYKENDKFQLKVQASEATTPNYMVIKSASKKLKLTIDANEADRAKCWIDLNGNYNKDAGETIDFGNEKEYTATVYKTTIYGKVAKLKTNATKYIDTQNNPELKELFLNKTQVSSLNLVENKNLETLHVVSENEVYLEELHLPKNEKLKKIVLIGSKIKDLDVSGNKKLEYLVCIKAELNGVIDLSEHKALRHVNFLDNKNITTVNVANGHNAEFTRCLFSKAPNLKCIQVDEDFVPPAATWKKDATATWNNTTIPCGELTDESNFFISLWDTEKPSTDYLANDITPSNNQQILFPGIGENYTLLWEEQGNPTHRGTLSNISATEEKPVTIDFGAPGKYLVKVAPAGFKRIAMSNDEHRIGDTEKLMEIQQWGAVQWTSMKYAFSVCKNMELTATDTPNLSGVKDMSFMFAEAKYFNQDISNWDVSGVKDMSWMFKEATSFNQPLNNWDVSGVKNMYGMFHKATFFNQPLNNWDVSGVKNMSFMFGKAISFNQPLNNWDVSSVKDMPGMFGITTSFNQPLNNWDVSGVEDMSYMFIGATSFNQDISNWDVSKVKDMSFMFEEATSFNQPLNNWDVSSVKDMPAMFGVATSFNQDISNWDVSGVKNMSSMFKRATSFNQSLGKWNLKSVTDMRDMLNNCGMSCSNYGTTLMGWAKNAETPNNIKFGAKGMEYVKTGKVATARQTLIDKGWSIYYDEGINTCR